MMLVASVVTVFRLSSMPFSAAVRLMFAQTVSDLMLSKNSCPSHVRRLMTQVVGALLPRVSEQLPSMSLASIRSLRW